MKRKLIAILMILVLAVPIIALAAGGTSAAPTNVKPNKIRITGTKKVAVGKKIQLKAKVYPAAASQKVKWSSSDKSIATVNKNGVVTGKSAGKVKITAKSTVNKKIKKSVTITVTGGSSGGSGNYRALLIGNGLGYDSGSQLQGPPNDVKAMKNMLAGLKQKWQITAKNDLGADGMRSAIRSAFSGSGKNDVCLFYYSGHGYSQTGMDDYEGALAGVDNTAFTGQQLAYALNENCKGKVIVLLDSCGSGGMIYDRSGNPADPKIAANKFVNSMISAFSYYNAKQKNQKDPKTGELLGDKFIVIAACEYRDYSYDVNFGDHYGGAFTVGLLKALGCDHPNGHYSGSMPADKNHDKKITLKEAYDGIVSNVTSPQVTQMHGSTSFIMFTR